MGSFFCIFIHVSSLKKYIKEYINVFNYDSNMTGGYGTMNQKMKSKQISSNIFPYLEKDDEIQDDVFDSELDQEKFDSKVGLTREPIEKDIAFRDKKHFVDGATRGISDSILKKYIDLVFEDVFHNMSFRSSTAPDYVTNQFGHRVLDGTLAGWSHPNHLPDEGEEPVFDLDDLIKNHFDEENI